MSESEKEEIIFCELCGYSIDFKMSENNKVTRQCYNRECNREYSLPANSIIFDSNPKYKYKKNNVITFKDETKLTTGINKLCKTCGKFTHHKSISKNNEDSYDELPIFVCTKCAV